MYKLFYFVIVAVISYSTAFGEINWISAGGPFGGRIVDISTDIYGCLYATSYSSVYRSVNNGNSWQRVETGDLPVGRIFFDNNSNAFLITETEDYSNELFRSDDLKTWYLSNSGMQGLAITKIINSDGGKLNACTSNGVFQSSDCGMTWNLKYFVNFAPTNYVYTIGFSPDGNIFYGTLQGLYKSTDDGVTWTEVNDSEQSFSTNIEHIKFHNGFIFVSTPSGLYRSSDQGDTWTKLSYGLVGTNISFIIFLTENEILAGTSWSGMYYSMDNGDSWLNVSMISCSDALRIFDNIYVASSEGVLVANNPTNPNWISKNKGILDLSITALCVVIRHGTHDGEIIAGDDNGVIYKSTDDGSNWTKVYSTGSSGITELKYVEPGVVLASTMWGGVFISSDYGETWENKSTDLWDMDVRSIEFDDLGYYYAGTFSTIFKSVDKGETWSECYSSSPSIQCQTVSKNSLGHIFVGNNLHYILRSTDNGATWEQKSNGLTSSIQIIKVNSFDELYAVSSNGNLYKSVDNGENWQLVNNEMGIKSMMILPNDDILISVDRFEHSDLNVYLSGDGGASFLLAEKGLYNTYTYCLAKNKENIIFAGTERGVYKTTEAVDVDDNSSELATFSVSPNPATDFFTVSISGMETGSSQISLTDIFGNTVNISKPNNAVAGASFIDMDCSNISSGIYFVNVTASGKRKTKLIIIKK